MKKQIPSIRALFGKTILVLFAALLLPSALAAQDLTQAQKQTAEKAKKDLVKAEEVFQRDPRSSTFTFHFGNARRNIDTLPKENPVVKELQSRLDRMDPSKPKEAPPTEKKEESSTTNGKESAGPQLPSEPHPEGFVEALNLLKGAFAYKEWTEEKVQSAADFRKEKIHKALIDSAIAIERVEAGKHREYLDYYHNNIETKLWPGLWKMERPRLLATAKAQECYDHLYKNTSQWSSGSYNSTNYDPAAVAAWAEKFKNTIITLQKARNLWDEVLSLDPNFNSSEAARLNKRLKDMGPAAEAKQNELMDRALSEINSRVERTTQMLNGLKERGQATQQILDHAQGLAALGEGIGAPKEMQDKLKSLAQEVETYVIEQNKEKAEALQREIEARKAPVEKYSGSDKDELREMISAKWKTLHPKDEVLGIRMTQENYERSVEWNWSSADKAYYKTDMSILTGHVIVKLDDTSAMIYPVYINQNNMKGTKNVGANTKGNEFVHRKMLVKNF